MFNYREPLCSLAFMFWLLLFYNFLLIIVDPSFEYYNVYIITIHYLYIQISDLVNIFKKQLK